MYRITVLAVLAVLGATLAGCGGNKVAEQSLSPYQVPGNFDESGMPREAFLVGRGANIAYTPRVAGTAFYVDLSNRRYLQTKTLGAGERIAVQVPHKTDDDLRLYFIPD